MNVTVIVDAGTILPEDAEFVASPQTSTEGHVIGALRNLGHEVRIIGVEDDLAGLVAALTQHPPDIVFNLAEQFRDNRRLDKNLPALLEMMAIPFTGSGPTGLMLCRDKGLCKQLLNFHKIRVPDFAVLAPNRPMRVPKRLAYPVIVKPVYEDGSEGIAMASVVRSEQELADRVRFVHERYRQPAIAEQYIEGRELYVAVLGDKRLRVFPPREIRFGGIDQGGPVIATSRVKWDTQYREKWRIEYDFAEVTDAQFASIQRICKRVFRLLRLNDYGRIDLRLAADDKIFILEANPNPDLAYGEDFAEAVEKGGLEYDALIRRILGLAMRRQEPA